MISIFSISSIFCMLTKLSIVISSGIAKFHNLWSQDFENAQCLEESQVGYTQGKKRFTHTISVTKRPIIFLTTISGPNHQRECRHRESSNDQLPRLKQILIPCTILNRYSSTCIVYKESLKCYLSTSLVFICSKIAHKHIFVNNRRSESKLLDNVFQPDLIFNVSSCLRSPHPHPHQNPPLDSPRLPSASRE